MTIAELIDSIYNLVDGPANEMKSFLLNTARQQAEAFDANFATLKTSNAALLAANQELVAEKAKVDAQLSELGSEDSSHNDKRAGINFEGINPSHRNIT